MNAYMIGRAVGMQKSAGSQRVLRLLKRLIKQPSHLPYTSPPAIQQFVTTADKQLAQLSRRPAASQNFKKLLEDLLTTHESRVPGLA